MNTINVGIVGDGPTDYKVFGKIIECILFEETSENIKINAVPLIRKNIFDHVQKYIRACGKNKNPDGYYLLHKTAVDSICATILAACEDFFNENIEFCYGDILLITTDTEHILKDKNQYFDPWAISVSHILREAIEKFYNTQATNGYQRKCLPIIMPLATFPSTEVLVAAARGELNKHYGKNPREWKMLLYKTEHPQDEQIEQEALDYITPETIDYIFNDLPEARFFIQTLSLGLKRCFLNSKSNCEKYI
ncbi:hypothetical protein FJR06_13860 [Dolichospermum sp. UHCC 0352]|jgi:hypothetical protein|uniref:hypothetical protein n=1 Tax=Dolichospermum sp. UHCC 0352 TaxID=2590011 RepID=UPI0014466388|nr:hypothetical protein [Dolichospermum sp. UHCC 0352]MTJ22343.1 hypothetical protein [Dolichospermum sp. UHCC 0352]